MKCKFCAEEILNDAIVCKHCGRSIKNDDGKKMIIGFAMGFIIAAIGIKSAWGPNYTWDDILGIVIITGVILGGILAMIAKKF
jgi:hypothetical protein